MSKPSIADLLASACRQVSMLPIADATGRLEDPQYVFIDVRELHEVSEGMIPGSAHAPRSNLEWLLDPSSERCDPIFQSQKTFVFVCGSGGRAVLMAVRTRLFLAMARTSAHAIVLSGLH